MTVTTTRRRFIGLGSAAAAAGAIGLLQRAGAQSPPASAQPTTPPAPTSEIKWETPPGLKAEDVRAIVGAAHRDLDKVREMLDAQPSLVNCTWDWGAGDYESPLGAAGHTGQVGIAELVLSRGARLELHAAAMLGWLEVIKAAVAARPGAENILGPHAIPMHSHALTGGEQAKPVLDYLESLNAIRQVMLSDEERPKYVGRYQTEGGVLTVFDANRRLLLQPPPPSGRRAWYLLHQGEGLFLPADNIEVKITFAMNPGGTQTRAMNMVAGDDQTVAVRVH
jgi:hypothetical protein